MKVQETISLVLGGFQRTGNKVSCYVVMQNAPHMIVFCFNTGKTFTTIRATIAPVEIFVLAIGDLMSVTILARTARAPMLSTTHLKAGITCSMRCVGG